MTVIIRTSFPQLLRVQLNNLLEFEGPVGNLRNGDSLALSAFSFSACFHHPQVLNPMDLSDQLVLETANVLQGQIDRVRTY